MANNKQLPHTASESIPGAEQWKGYTLDEIRYARAYTAARMELNRERLMARIENVSKTGFTPASTSNLVGKVLSAFSYLDIAMLAWRIGSRAFKFTRALKRR